MIKSQNTLARAKTRKLSARQRLKLELAGEKVPDAENETDDSMLDNSE